MPCTPEKKFAAALATGSHLLVQLKGNQAQLSAAVGAMVARNAPTDTAASQNKGRSRQEERTVEIFPVDEGLANTEWGPFIKTIIRVTRHIWLRHAATGLWDQRRQVAHYVSSAEGLRASTWADIVRGHWGTENRNHYVRDVSCEEDRSRIRNNPGIIARARSFALNILRHNGATNVAQALWSGALKLDHILAYKAI